MDEHKELYPNTDIPKSLYDKKAEVLNEMKLMREQTEPIMSIMQKEEVLKAIQSSRDGRQLFEILNKEHDVSKVVLKSFLTN